MSVAISQYQNVVVLTVKEELVGEAVDVFNAEANKCLDQSQFHLLVDCSNSGGFDSAALEALLDLQNKCEEQLGAVKLCGLDATCSKILEITRLTRRFECFNDLESAVKSFG